MRWSRQGCGMEFTRLRESGTGCLDRDGPSRSPPAGMQPMMGRWTASRSRSQDAPQRSSSLTTTTRSVRRQGSLATSLSSVAVHPRPRQADRPLETTPLRPADRPERHRRRATRRAETRPPRRGSRPEDRPEDRQGGRREDRREDRRGGRRAGRREVRRAGRRVGRRVDRRVDRRADPPDIRPDRLGTRLDRREARPEDTRQE